MSGWELVLRGLQWRWVASLLNTISVGLGVGLVCAVLAIHADLRERFEAPGRGFGLVVGAPGSAQQLVLNAVFHLGESPGRVPLELWHELSEHRSTALVVPYAVGDSFRGFPVVATTDAFFDPRFPHPVGERPEDKLREARPLRYDAEALERIESEEHDEHTASDEQEHTASAEQEHELDHAHEHEEELREAVVGSVVAESVGLRVGDRIELAHGLEEGAIAHEHEALWEVVGILEETGTAIDRVVLINLDSFLAMEDHEGEPGLSALLVFPRRGVHTAILMGELRSRSDLQVAHVGNEVRNLLSMIGRVDTLFLLIALLVVVVAVLSIFSSTYLTTRARRGQLGVLRALGLARRSVLMLVVAEASLLAFVGAVLGGAGAHALLFLTSGAVDDLAGFHPDPARLMWSEALAMALVTAAGALAGLLPGVQAYRVDVAASLRHVE